MTDKKWGGVKELLNPVADTLHLLGNSYHVIQILFIGGLRGSPQWIRALSLYYSGFTQDFTQNFLRKYELGDFGLTRLE